MLAQLFTFDACTPLEPLVPTSFAGCQSLPTPRANPSFGGLQATCKRSVQGQSASSMRRVAYCFN